MKGLRGMRLRRDDVEVGIRLLRRETRTRVVLLQMVLLLALRKIFILEVVLLLVGVVLLLRMLELLLLGRVGLRWEGKMPRIRYCLCG